MITIVYSTRKENPSFQEELRKTIGIKKYQVLEYVNDGEYSLTELYNKGLKEAENDIVVFCHDDIYFDKKNWANKIFKSFPQNFPPGSRFCTTRGASPQFLKPQWTDDFLDFLPLNITRNNGHFIWFTNSMKNVSKFHRNLNQNNLSSQRSLFEAD